MRTALLVIDAQASFAQRPNWRDVSNPDLVANIHRLVAAARSHGELVVWVFHSEPGTGGVFDPELGYVTPLPGLDPHADEPRLTKTSHNAFTTTNLQQLLTTRQIGQVRITGIQTERCCETTARSRPTSATTSTSSPMRPRRSRFPTRPRQQTATGMSYAPIHAHCRPMR
ncbi:MAG TPA: isochorismatase family protein [Nocardioidaceae bacterium]|nr:isochorismatase family protein [Nocardioidaceae bacterium]